MASQLADYLYYHATKAELLTALGRREEAAAALERALALAENEAERRLLQARLSRLGG